MLALGHLPAWTDSLVAAAEPAAPLRRSPGSWRSLLGFGLVNLGGLAFAAEATWIGWTERLLAGDSTGTSHLILAVFAAGLGLAGREALRIARLREELRRDPPAGEAGRLLDRVAGLSDGGRARLEGAFKLELASRIGHVRTIAGSLVLLGLIGTVLGFMLALAAVEPSTAADVERIGAMVAGLVQGMGVALHTTLLGAVLNVWLMFDYRLLEADAVRLLAELARRGDGRARARTL